jgi:hypothetical protein
MPDLETRLPELLRDLSSQAPSDLAGGSDRVVRRARRRRSLIAATAAVSVVVAVTAAVVGARTLAPTGRIWSGGSGSPGSSIPSPSGTGISAVWPERTAEGLASAQRQVDEGHQPWRADPAMTAEAFAVNVFGWPPDDVRSRTDAVPGPSDVVVVSVSNADGPATEVTLRQLGERGNDGVWSVTSADTQLVTTRLERDGVGDRRISVRIADGAPVQISYTMYRGDTLDSPVTGGVVADGSRIPLPSGSSTGTVVAVVSAIAGGRVVGADVLGVATAVLPSASATDGPTAAPPSAGLPPAVAGTREAIVHAVDTGDIAALARLMDLNTFSYNFDDGSDPIPAWKADPSVLDPILTLLQLQPAEPKVIEGYGTFYVWPYLVDSDLEHPTAGEIEDLHRLGFDDAAIERMRRLGSYDGPRLAIDEDGLWRSYTTRGE